MLSNAYFLAKIRFDTAENERNVAEICQKLATSLRVHYPNLRRGDPLVASASGARPLSRSFQELALPAIYGEK